jgi:CBS domain-containing protein
MTNRRLAEIIRHQTLQTLRPNASVQQACRCMHHHDIGAILVVDDIGRLVGIFTGRDAVRCLAEARDPEHTLLQGAMTHKPESIAPGHTAIDALRLMRDGGFRHVPVVDADGRAHGIVSQGDFRGLEHDRLDEETGYWERIG